MIFSLWEGTLFFLMLRKTGQMMKGLELTLTFVTFPSFRPVLFSVVSVSECCYN